jgi:non-ribosomal peptide synthetase component F
MSRKNIEAINSLSPAQQGMLYETIHAPESGIHIEQSIYTLTGKLNAAAFERVWQWEVDRHTILRTGFVWKEHSEPLQVTLRQVHVAFDYQDWREVSFAEQRTRIENYLKEDRTRGFQLSQPPLMRLVLFHLDEQAYRLVWTCHHILMDGWSHQVLLNEIITCYAAMSKDQEFHLEPSRPYSDYVVWLKKQDVSRAEQFWRKTLHGFTKPTLLGREQEKDTPCELEERYGSLQIQLSNSVTGALQSITRRRHLTLNTIVQGVWAVLLSRYSGTEDVVFGITVSGRPADLVGVETMVGLCMNTLPLRIHLPAQASLWSWFDDLQRQNIEMRDYEYSSAGQVHQWSDIPGMSLLYESLLVVENYPTSTPEVSSTKISISVDDICSIGAQTKYALTFLVTTGATLVIRCVYDTRRFEKNSIRYILSHFHLILKCVASAPEMQLAVLSGLISADQIPIVYPVLTVAQTRMASAYQALHNPIEELVAAAWCDVLGLSQVGMESNFFEIGGHSLVANQLISRLRAVLGVEVPLRAVFEEPTVAGLARQVEQVLRKRERINVPPLVARERPEEIPLSFAQQRLWLLDQLEPGSIAYLMPSAYRLHGMLDAKCFERSLEELIRRHESLRTTFTLHADQPVQVIHPVRGYCLPMIDLQKVREDEQTHVVRQLAEQEAQHPCNLTSGPLLRTYLLRLKAQEHVLLLTLHHIITDGWSTGVLVHELTTLYRAFVAGLPSPLAPLPIQYADYALWQRQWLQGEVLQQQVAYWKKQLWRAKPAALPTDASRVTLRGDHGAIYSLRFPTKLSEELVTLSRQEGVTLFMLLLAAFQVLFYRLTGQRDIVVGTDVANRTHMETEGLIGFFVNLLALRMDVRGAASFREVVQQVRAMVLEAYTHQELPFDRVVEQLQIERRDEQTPLVQVLFVLQNTPRSLEKLPGITIEPIQAESPTARFDLAFFLYEGAEGLSGHVVYRATLFKEQTIAVLVHRLKVLLRDAVVKPDTSVDDLEISTDEEKTEQANYKEELYRVNRKHLQSSKSKSIDVSELHF